MYVNGAPVFVLGRPEDAPRLAAVMHIAKPIQLGDSNKDAAESGIADLRVLNAMADPQEAELLYRATRIDGAVAKARQDLSAMDTDALATFYVQTLDPAAAPLVSRLHAVDGSPIRDSQAVGYGARHAGADGCATGRARSLSRAI